MKWFKHMIASRNDPDLIAARKLFGPAGPHIFWTALEFYGAEFDHFDPNGDGFLAVSWSDFREKCGKSSSKVEVILNFFSTILRNGESKPRILWRRDGEYLLLKVPKFIDIADEYTSKRIARQLRTNSGHAPDKLPNEVEVEVEVEQTLKPLVVSNQFFSVSETDHNRYQEDYLISDKELRREYKQMEIWLEANPKKRKKNYQRFIVNWLSRNYQQRKAVHDAKEIVKAAAVKPSIEPKPDKPKAPLKNKDEELAKLAKWEKDHKGG